MKVENQSITRNDFVSIINEKKYKLGIEIGVAQGNYSKYILKNSSIEIMYLIDPFLPESEGHYCTKEVTNENLLELSGRYIILPMKSEEAIYYIRDNFVDFIYIDGDHRQPEVEKDLKIWYPKLKVGGLFSGHDYCPAQPGVIHAVNTFCEKYLIETLNITSLSEEDEKISGKEANAQSWFFYKI